jgi:hypothetical protein
MKTTKTEAVTRIWCDVCGRQLTNTARECLNEDTVHLCLEPTNRNWLYPFGILPSCYNMYRAGVRKVVMEERTP